MHHKCYPIKTKISRQEKLPISQLWMEAIWPSHLTTLAWQRLQHHEHHKQYPTGPKIRHYGEGYSNTYAINFIP